MAVPLIVLATLPRADLALYPTSRMVLVLALLIAPALLALWLTMRPLHRPPLPRWFAPAVLARSAPRSAWWTARDSAR